MTMTSRPRNLAMASHAPKGAPITNAMTLADRLTRSDSATMLSSSGSREPIRARAEPTDRAKSLIRKHRLCEKERLGRAAVLDHRRSAAIDIDRRAGDIRALLGGE